MARTIEPVIAQAKLLDLLPRDGTPVPNRIVRSMLSRALEVMVDGETYFRLIEALEEQGKIGRSRGRGGRIFVCSTPDRSATPATPAPAPAPAPAPSRWSEAELMRPLRVFIEKEFVRYLDIGPGSTAIVTDTSELGPRMGQWARPDFILVTVMNFRLIPGQQLDVHAFELKASYGGSVQAVHEALAQTRFTHFGHLVWHVPQGSREEILLPEIEEHCNEHGIGLIVIRDPEHLASWEIRLDPKQKATSRATIDAFLMSRLPAIHRDEILTTIGRR